VELDPSEALQQGIVAWLAADRNVVALVADRVWDKVPDDQPENVEEGWPFPYVTVGEGHVLAEYASGYEGADTMLTVHCWSRAAGFPQVKQIGAAVVASLHGAALDLDGFRLVDFQFQTARYFRDKDGLTSHGVLMFQALTDAI
jgi:Protein of unknown function (DUF3168)